MSTMHKRVSHRREGSSLADERLRQLTCQLKDFFHTSEQSHDLLRAIFEQYHPSPSVHESIISLYANSLSKPTLNRLLDRSVEYLHLNDGNNHSEEVGAVHSLQYHRGTQTCQLLHHAVMKNYENVFRLLLNSGFNPNSLLSDCKTPLSMAVVASNIDPVKRLEYIQVLIANGANPLIRDVNDVSPFKRLCGLDSNHPIVYTYFRDHLLSLCGDEAQLELNAGLQNALFNWCVPIVIDLLEHGATLDTFQTVDSLVSFFHLMASTFLRERRSVSHIDAFVVCLIQLLSHGVPCANYAVCLERFFQCIYIPSVCFETNNDPFAYPAMTNVKKLLSISFHYGYLTRTCVNAIRTVHFPKILTTPIENPLVTPLIRQGLVDTLNQHIEGLIAKYHHSPAALSLLAARKIRWAMVSVNRKTIERLNISQHLKRTLL